jgi:hypothetical protein
MPLLLQLAALGALTAYFAWWRAYMSRRNKQSWKQAVDQLPFAPKPEAPRAAQEISALVQGVWMEFQKARVILEMTDYAERNVSPESVQVDPELLGSIRKDAMQVRVAATVALAKATVATSTAEPPKTHA